MSNVAAACRGRYLGVDMGGSGLRACLLHEPGLPERWTAGGGNLAVDAAGATRLLVSLVREVSPEAVCLGLAGVRTAPAAAVALRRDLLVFTNRVTVMSDADLALAAAFGAGIAGDSTRDGIVLSAGTGTVAAARFKGVTFIVGGHGYVFGDHGGGFDVGRRLVAETLRARDLALEGSKRLVDDVELLLGTNLDAFVAETYLTGPAAVRARLAGLATHLGDVKHPAAGLVAEATASALVQLGQDARSRFGTLPVRFRGGIFNIPRVEEAVRIAFEAKPVTADPAETAAGLAAQLWVA